MSQHKISITTMNGWGLYCYIDNDDEWAGLVLHAGIRKRLRVHGAEIINLAARTRRYQAS